VQTFDFAALLEAMPDAVVVADMQSRIVYANASVERLLGWAPGGAGRPAPPRASTRTDAPPAR